MPCYTRYFLNNLLHFGVLTKVFH